MTHSTLYIDALKCKVFTKISSEITTSTIEIVVNDLRFHLDNNKSLSFQDYYFRTLSNEDHYFRSSNFFRKFKSKYSLQGVDSRFLDNLEEKKKQIIDFIKKNDLIGLYFEIFYEVKVKDKEGTKEKTLSSFFTKFVHTFKPEQYCALDNPVKKFLGLSKEGFFVSFIIISEVYAKWSAENRELVSHIRNRFSELDTSRKFDHQRISDLKLLDLIFWRKADKKKKEDDQIKERRKATKEANSDSVEAL